MNRIRSLIVAATAVAMAALSTPTWAGGGGGYYVQHYWITCAAGTGSSGTIGEISFEPFTKDLGGMFAASGTIVPCRTPYETDAFAIGRYYSYGTADGVARAYPGTSTVYTGLRGFINYDTVAMCLIVDETTRLDCVAIEWVDTGEEFLQPVAGAHLPTDAPEVSIRAMTDLRIYHHGPDPGCTGCDD